MKINMSKIKDYEKVFQSFDGNYLFLDASEKKLYCNSSINFMVLNLEIEDVKDEEKKIYALNKDEFIHTMEYADSISMDSECNYSDDTGTFKGTLKNNNDCSDFVEPIKEKLDFDMNSFNESFECSEEIVRQLNRASIFVDGGNITDCYKYLDVKDGFVFSSSNYRIYINTIEIGNNCIINQKLLQFMNMIPNPKVYNSENQEFVLKNDDIIIYFNASDTLDYIGILGEFKERYSKVYNANRITINPKELISKLNFISYYAKTSPNTRCVFSSENGVYKFSVGNNSTVVNISDSEITEEGEFEAPINSSSLLEIVSRLSCDKDVDIYMSKDVNRKLFVVKFNNYDNEEVVLAKLQE